MSPKATIVIPTYNRAHLIMRTLQSALRQDYPSFEVVIIDDSKNDETEKIVKELNDSKIKYVHNTIKGNVPKARNQGVRESSGETKYVAFLDDDNELLPEFLKKGVDALETDASFVGAVPMAEHRFDDGTMIAVQPEMYEVWNSGLGNGSLLRKELFMREGIWFNEKLATYEDWDMGLRVFRSHKLKQLPDVLEIYYHHYPATEGSTASTSPLSVEATDYLYNTYYDYYAAIGAKPLATFYFRLGKIYCRAGAIKKGKNLFLKAFARDHETVYLRYYAFWSFPWFARKFHFENILYWKYRLYDKFLRHIR